MTRCILSQAAFRGLDEIVEYTKARKSICHNPYLEKIRITLERLARYAGNGAHQVFFGSGALTFSVGPNKAGRFGEGDLPVSDRHSISG